MLDKKKREREKLGSVNLRADEETGKYETEIKKMGQDRQDLVAAIIKLIESINALDDYKCAQKERKVLEEEKERVVVEEEGMVEINFKTKRKKVAS